jgi:hypothetical protein
MEDVRTMVDYWWNCNVPCRVQLVVFTWICAVWCVELGMRREVWWSFIMSERKVRRLVVPGQTKLSVLICSPCWPCHWRNVCPWLTCRWCDMQYPGPFFLWGVIRKCFCSVIQGRCQCAFSAQWRVVSLSTGQKRHTDMNTSQAKWRKLHICRLT